ncbi:MAG: VOC family protein [Sphingomonas sp.]|uniref:VOC family protein n=1 Tax=Sphingomonas sp. TaxID=28214 RepID=UPI00180DC158|nr:VOC family protein [Sphingomonas sp.]MBA3667788.1 VOC family protein [Sphingomonas sp.]
MLDHIGIAISNIARSEAFYAAALVPLGITKLYEYGPDKTDSGGTAIGFGKDKMPFFWVGDNERVGEGTHVAFTAADRAGVDAFYEAAMKAGGRDNGAPGLRSKYHPNYYAAFVLDPDGINVEAVSHKPE